MSDSLGPPSIDDVLDAFAQDRLTFAQLRTTLEQIARTEDGGWDRVRAVCGARAEDGRLPAALLRVLVPPVVQGPLAPPPVVASAPSVPDTDETDPEAARDPLAATDALVFDDYLQGFRRYRRARQDGADGPAADRSFRQLDTALETWRGLRFRSQARKGGAGPGRAGLPESERPDLGLKPTPGLLVKDRFVLDRLIGRGAKGEVYRAVDRRMLEAKAATPYVALKFLSGPWRHDPVSFQALEREARKAQALAHPNIVPVYDFDRDRSLVYLVMPLLEGRPLDALLRDRGDLGVPLAEAGPWIVGIANGLAYAHASGVVHADIKPGNIFMTVEGGPKLLDFGLAVATAGPETEQIETGCTPAYASLNLCAGGTPRPADDLYALGCTVYELLTGFHPYGRLPAEAAQTRRRAPNRIRALPRRAWRVLAASVALTEAAPKATAADFARAFKPGWRWFG